jgi:hypothetical protein
VRSSDHGGRPEERFPPGQVYGRCQFRLLHLGDRISTETSTQSWKGVRENGVRITMWSEKDRKKSDDDKKGDKEIMSVASDEGGRSSPPFFRQNGILRYSLTFTGVYDRYSFAEIVSLRDSRRPFIHAISERTT